MSLCLPLPLLNNVLAMHTHIETLAFTGLASPSIMVSPCIRIISAQLQSYLEADVCHISDWQYISKVQSLYCTACECLQKLWNAQAAQAIGKGA